MTELLRYDEDVAFTLADDAATVSAIVRRVPADRLRATTFGEWTALDLIGHVVDTAELFAQRVRRCQEEDAPSLQSVETDDWVRERHDGRDAMDCAKRLAAAHALIVRLLGVAGAAERRAVHSVQGPVNAGHLAAYQAKHSREHATVLSAAFPPE